MAGQKLSAVEIKQLIQTYESAQEMLKFQLAENKRVLSDLKAALDAAKKEEGSKAEPTAKAAKKNKPKSKADKAPKTEKEKNKPGRPRKNKEVETEQATPPTAVATTEEPTPEAAPAKVRKPRAKAAPDKKTEVTETPTAEVTPAKVRKPRAKAAPDKEIATPKAPRLSATDEMIFSALAAKNKTMISAELSAYVTEQLQASGQSTSSDEIALLVSRSLHKLVNKHGILAKVPYEGKGFAYALPQWLDAAGQVKPRNQRKKSA